MYTQQDRRQDNKQKQQSKNRDVIDITNDVTKNSNANATTASSHTSSLHLHLRHARKQQPIRTYDLTVSDQSKTSFCQGTNFVDLTKLPSLKPPSGETSGEFPEKGFQLDRALNISLPGNQQQRGLHRGGGSKRRVTARKRADQSQAAESFGGQSASPDFKIEGRRIHLPQFSHHQQQQRAYFAPGNGYQATTLPLVVGHRQVSNSNRYTFGTPTKQGSSPDQELRRISTDSNEGKSPGGDCCNAFGLILGGLCGGGPSGGGSVQGENPSSKIPVKSSLLRFIGAKSRDSRQQVCFF